MPGRESHLTRLRPHRSRISIPIDLGHSFRSISDTRSDNLDTDSDDPTQTVRLPVGITVQLRSESLSTFRRNHCPDCVGARTGSGRCCESGRLHREAPLQGFLVPL